MRHAKIFAAEFIGTMLLFVVGLNAVFNEGISTPIGLALSIGVTVVAISAIMGPVSGAHINPAVTIGLAIMRKVEHDKVLTYLAAQFLGGIAGGLIAFWMARGREGGFSPDEGNFAISGWEQLGGGYDWVTMALAVSILTGVVVLTYVAVASRGEPRAGSSLAVGLAYTAVVYAGLEMVGIAVNPALSFGAAVFAGGDAFEQVWLVMLFAVVGAALGVMMYLAAEDVSLEDTMLGESALARKARDIGTTTVHGAADVTAGAAGAVGDVADKVTDTVSDAADAVKDKLTGDDD